MGSKMKAVVLNNQVINIGDWDYQITTSEEGIETVGNPLPEGAEVGDFDVVQNASGQYVLQTDYKKLRAAEYPSIGDQLDALFKAGAFPEEMSALIAEVKNKYPKPDTAA